MIGDREEVLVVPRVVGVCADLHLESCRSTVRPLFGWRGRVAAALLQHQTHSAPASALVTAEAGLWMVWSMQTSHMTDKAEFRLPTAMAASTPVMLHQRAQRRRCWHPESGPGAWQRVKSGPRASRGTAARTATRRSCRCRGLTARPLRHQVSHHCWQQGRSASPLQAVRRAAYKLQYPARRHDSQLQPSSQSRM